MHLLQWKSLYFYKNYTEVYLKSPINNKSALAQVMACVLIGDKLISEQVMV